MKIKNGVRPAYLQIEQDLRDKIEKGYYKVGDRLTEKELAGIYNVSRLTLKKATSLLSSKGYLSQTPGRGTFITSLDESNNLKDTDVLLKKMNRGIGILISCVTGYLYPGIIRGVEDVCEEAGYHLVLGNYDAKPEKERKYMETFVSRGISGLAIAASFNSHQNPYYKILKEKNVPFVLVDTSVEGIDADFVATDNFKGAYLGTKSLINKDCSNILYITTNLSASSNRERFQGYKEALKEMGIPFRKELVRESRSGHPPDIFAEETTRKFLADGKIDAIFSANEPLIFGILRAIKEKELTGAETIRIVSFDKPEIPSALACPITFVAQPRYDIGRTACELLLERIAEKRRGIQTPCKKILLEPELVETEKEDTKWRERDMAEVVSL